MKKIMKSQKMSYARLASLIDIPESTVKKWFLADDGPMKRINLVSRALGTSLDEVIKMMKQQSVHTIKMDQKLQEYFIKNRKSFELYWLLSYERKSLQEIENLLGLSGSELRSILLKLDRFKLIEYSSKEKATIPKLRPVRWSPEGPFMIEIFKSWSAGIISDGLNSQGETNLILQFFQINADTEKELRKDLLALEEKYARRTTIELNGAGQKIKQFRFISALAEGSFLKL